MITPKVKEIRRDRDGFATEDCKDEMYNDLPILLYNNVDNTMETVDKYCWSDFVGDIETKPYYTHYVTATIS